MKHVPYIGWRAINRLLPSNWYKQGKIKINETSTAKVLKGYGIDVVDVKELLWPARPKARIEINGCYDRSPPLDENHPDFKTKACFFYNGESVLLLGLDQAKVLTNTVEFEGLPDEVNELEKSVRLPKEMHSELIKRIMLSCVFDPTQEKLPVRKDPARPAWTFPRDYGITDRRKNDLLCKNLVMVSEQCIQGRNKSVVHDVFFSAPLEAHKKNLQFELTSQLVVTTSKKLKMLLKPSLTHDRTLPDLYPVNCSVGLSPTNFYTIENVYPFSLQSKYPYVQTAFIHLNNTVKNIFDDKVTESQIHGRSLMTGFTIAAAEAQAMFGEDVGELPEPVVVPVVHTDGKMFHFTIYQLNTLDIDGSPDVKNIFWNSPRLPLYEKCQYELGKPVLQGYNEEVIRKIISFVDLE